MQQITPPDCQISNYNTHVGSSNNNAPILSIIIPTYNCGSSKDFQSLVRNLHNQNSADFEIILCDDGSSDATSEILQDLVATDSRFRVVLDSHNGVSHARNNGLNAARGKWVAFVDADDRVTSSFVSSVLNKVSVSSDINLLIHSYAIVTTSGFRIFRFDEQEYRTPDEIAELITTRRFLYRCSPWAKCFKRSTLNENQLRFDEKLHHSEDRLFFYNYLLHTTGIVTLPDVVYYYGSLSSASLKHKRFPAEMYLYRQVAMGTAAHKVCKHYGIALANTYHMANNLATLLTDACIRIYEQYGCSSQCATIQEKLLDDFSKTGINLAENQRISERIKTDRRLKLIWSRRFKLLNYDFAKDQYKLRFLQFLHKIIYRNKGVQRSIDDYITVMN